MVSLICLTLFFLLLLTMFRKNTDVFAPARLFSLIWLLTIGMAELKFSRFQKEWSFYSWIVMLIPVFSFLLGIFIIYVLKTGRPKNTFNETRQFVADSVVDTELLLKIFVVLSFIYIVSYAVSYAAMGYVPMFTKVPGVSRNNWGIFGFGLFVQAVPAIAFLGALYMLKGKRSKIVKTGIFIILLAVFGTYSLLLQRYYIICAIVIISLLFYYGSNFFKPRNMVIMLVAALVVMFGMSYIRLSGTIVNYLYYLSAMKYNIKYAVFTEPYMYMVMNTENYANAVNYLSNYTYGFLSFDFIFALTGIKHTVMEYLSVNGYPYMITNDFNTYTSFFVYYQDFGVAGVFLMPLALGSAFSMIYHRLYSRPSLEILSLYILAAFAIMFSFFVPIITFLHFAFNAALIYFTVKYVATKRNL